MYFVSVLRAIQHFLKIHFSSLVLAHIFYLLVLDIEIKIRLIFFRPNNSILEIILLTIR
jgi:hypothetical protein